jgi:hypothetical protein
MGRDRDSLRTGMLPYREEEARRGVQGAVQTCHASVYMSFAMRCGLTKQPLFPLHAAVPRLFSRYFTENSGWTLPALFSILRDLRDLAFDVSSRRGASWRLSATQRRL